MSENDSGRYQIADGVISYHSGLYGSWELPISEVAAIGEYTNEDGPYADDYFLVFVTHQNSGWFEGSFYGEGREELLRGLSLLLGCEISWELSHSTTFNSRVLWPETKRGEALFDFQPQGTFKNQQGFAIAHRTKARCKDTGDGHPSLRPESNAEHSGKSQPETEARSRYLMRSFTDLFKK